MSECIRPVSVRGQSGRHFSHHPIIFTPPLLSLASSCSLTWSLWAIPTHTPPHPDAFRTKGPSPPQVKSTFLGLQLLGGRSEICPHTFLDSSAPSSWLMCLFHKDAHPNPSQHLCLFISFFFCYFWICTNQCVIWQLVRSVQSVCEIGPVSFRVGHTHTHVSKVQESLQVCRDFFFNIFNFFLHFEVSACQKDQASRSVSRSVVFLLPTPPGWPQWFPNPEHPAKPYATYRGRTCFRRR